MGDKIIGQLRSMDKEKLINIILHNIDDNSIIDIIHKDKKEVDLAKISDTFRVNTEEKLMHIYTLNQLGEFYSIIYGTQVPTNKSKQIVINTIRNFLRAQERAEEFI